MGEDRAISVRLSLCAERLAFSSRRDQFPPTLPESRFVSALAATSARGGRYNGAV